MIILKLQSPILVKQIFLLLIVFTAISCTKENLSNTVVGAWPIIERKIGTGYGYETSPIYSQRVLHFNPNGTFQVADIDTNSYLHHFTTYQIQQDHITFYNADKTETQEVTFILNDDLQLFYPARCGYLEVFSRK